MRFEKWGKTLKGNAFVRGKGEFPKGPQQNYGYIEEMAWELLFY